MRGLKRQSRQSAELRNAFTKTSPYDGLLGSLIGVLSGYV
ncbi:hypothetical protein GGP73_003061 [Salinibacter ruber]|nr:hypothetical protein [Salinibacter ruber]